MAMCYNIQQQGVSLRYLISRGPAGAFSWLKGPKWNIIRSLHIMQAVAALSLVHQSRMPTQHRPGRGQSPCSQLVACRLPERAQLQRALSCVHQPAA